MRNFIIIFLLALFGAIICPAHHDADTKNLDNVVKQSLRNYKLSEECKVLTAGYLDEK